MADDIAQYKRAGARPVAKPAAEGDEATSALLPYKAFGEAPGAPRLWLKRTRLESQAPAYGYLSNIKTDSEGWLYVGLVYPALPLIVEIHGECLTALTEAIMKGSAAWVQEYDKERFIDPPAGEPIVHEIIIHAHRPPPEELTEH